MYRQNPLQRIKPTNDSTHSFNSFSLLPFLSNTSIPERTTIFRALMYAHTNYELLSSRATGKLIAGDPPEVRPALPNIDNLNMLFRFIRTMIEADLKRSFYPKFLKLLWGSNLDMAGIDQRKTLYQSLAILTNKGFATRINLLSSCSSPVKNDFNRHIEAIDAIVSQNSKDQACQATAADIKTRLNALRRQFAQNTTSKFNFLSLTTQCEQFARRYLESEPANSLIKLINVKEPLKLLQNIEEILKAIQDIKQQNQKNSNCSNQANNLILLFNKIKLGIEEAENLIQVILNFISRYWHEELFPDYGLSKLFDNNSDRDIFIHYIGYGLIRLINENQADRYSCINIAWLRDYDPSVFNKAYFIKHIKSRENEIRSLFEDAFEHMIHYHETQTKDVVSYQAVLAELATEIDAINIKRSAMPLLLNLEPSIKPELSNFHVNILTFAFDTTRQSRNQRQHTGSDIDAICIRMLIEQRRNAETQLNGYDVNQLPLKDYLQYHHTKKILEQLFKNLLESYDMEELIQPYVYNAFIPEPLVAHVSIAAMILYLSPDERIKNNYKVLTKSIDAYIPEIFNAITTSDFSHTVYVYLDRFIEICKEKDRSLDKQELSNLKNIFTVLCIINPAILNNQDIFANDIFVHFILTFSNNFNQPNLFIKTIANAENHAIFSELDTLLKNTLETFPNKTTNRKTTAGSRRPFDLQSSHQGIFTRVKYKTSKGRSQLIVPLQSTQSVPTKSSHRSSKSGSSKLSTEIDNGLGASVSIDAPAMDDLRAAALRGSSNRAPLKSARMFITRKFKGKAKKDNGKEKTENSDTSSTKAIKVEDSPTENKPNL